MSLAKGKLFLLLLTGGMIAVWLGLFSISLILHGTDARLRIEVVRSAR